MEVKKENREALEVCYKDHIPVMLKHQLAVRHMRGKVLGVRAAAEKLLQDLASGHLDANSKREAEDLLKVLQTKLHIFHEQHGVQATWKSILQMTAACNTSSLCGTALRICNARCHAMAWKAQAPRAIHATSATCTSTSSSKWTSCRETQLGRSHGTCRAFLLWMWISMTHVRCTCATGWWSVSQWLQASMCSCSRMTPMPPPQSLSTLLHRRSRTC